MVFSQILLPLNFGKGPTLGEIRHSFFLFSSNDPRNIDERFAPRNPVHFIIFRPIRSKIKADRFPPWTVRTRLIDPEKKMKQHKPFDQ